MRLIFTEVVEQAGQRVGAGAERLQQFVDDLLVALAAVGMNDLNTWQCTGRDS